MDAETVRKRYDPSKSLIHFHVIKTAGSSFRLMILEWFGDRRYPSHIVRDDTVKTIISEHFIRQYSSHIYERFPDKGQYITFLRDPFEQLKSFYFYWKDVNPDQELFIYGKRMKLRECARTFKEFVYNNPINFNDYLPEGKYPEDLLKFGFVGVQEQFNLCVKAFAKLYNLPVIEPKVCLVSNKSTEYVDASLNNEYRKLHPELFEQYDFVLKNWSPVWNQLANS